MKKHSIFAFLLLAVSLLIKLSAAIVLCESIIHSEEPHLHVESEHKHVIHKVVKTREPL